MRNISISSVGNHFADWRRKIHGLVEHELTLSLEDLRALPARTQITCHDCVEGWSCIGKWTGVPLSEILSRAGVRPEARFVVFHCADTLDDGSGFGADPESIRYYESIDPAVPKVWKSWPEYAATARVRRPVHRRRLSCVSGSLRPYLRDFLFTDLAIRSTSSLRLRRTDRSVISA
jgi:hypothetical protein